MADRRQALGRGLSALIPDTPPPREGPIELGIDLLTPNRDQPRRHVQNSGLEDLAQSIRSNGLIQPIVVRRRGLAYEIVAGERRWRAAQLAGLERVPVVVRDVPDAKLLELALIENIQRADLNPIEEASAYKRLTSEVGLTQDQVASAVGKDRSSVANFLRLLKLPEEVRADVASGTLSMGHARALLSLDGSAAQRTAAREIVARALSVREAEALVKRLAAPSAPKVPPAPDVHTRAAEDRMTLALGTRVRIVRKGKAGRIEIEFKNEDELQRIYEKLTE
jgi:ParB family chromosome partitioning protein